MTAWKHARLCLFVILSLINLSEEGCEDYFNVERMKEHLNHTVYLIETGELKDTLECTVERECIDGRKTYCLWLDHCYDRKDVPETETEKCKGNPSVEISHYHFGCLVSHDTLSEPVEGCKNYERVCKLHKEKQLIVSEETKPSQRPPPPPTPTTTTTTKATLPETTTAAATTTLPDTTRATTTATTTTTLPDTTRATTTTATTTTALSPTVTQSAVSGNNANNSKSVGGTENDNTNKDPIKILLGISLIFNVIAVLGGLYMRRRWTQDRKQWGNTLVFESQGYLTGAQLLTEPRSETLPSSADREEENIHLMTPQDCQSIITHSADRDSHCCAAGEEKHL